MLSMVIKVLPYILILSFLTIACLTGKGDRSTIDSTTGGGEQEGVTSTETPQKGSEKKLENHMELLQIDLQEGFRNDSVIIRVNGRELVRKGGVTTQLLLGYAEIFKEQVPEGDVEIEILIPSKNLSIVEKLQVSVPTYLGVSVRLNKIEIIKSPDPFSYG